MKKYYISYKEYEKFEKFDGTWDLQLTGPYHYVVAIKIYNSMKQCDDFKDVKLLIERE